MNAGFSLLVALRLGADAQEGQSLAPSASPALLPPPPLPPAPAGCGAVDTGRWPHQSSHPTSCFWSPWDANHNPKSFFPAFFFSQKRGPSRCGVAWGKDRRRHGGVWFQGFGLALLGSHHSLPGHWAPYPTQRHPVCRACVSPSLSSPEPHAVPQLKGFTCCKRDRQQSWD